MFQNRPSKRVRVDMSSFYFGSIDLVTAAGFVSVVVQLIDVTSKTVRYLNEVKDAPKDRAKLARETTGLLSLFTDLGYQVEDVELMGRT